MAGCGVATSKPDNPEHTALTKSFPNLVKCIARSPGEITDELIPFTIFSTKEKESLRSTRRLSDMEKARKIMDIVKSKVKSEPSFLDNFISILEEHEWMKPCTDELKQHLEAKKQTSQKSISASERTTVEATNPGPVIPDIQPVPDIYTKINEREQSVTLSTNLDRSDLKNRTTFIRQKFASVVTCVKNALKRTGVTTKDLADHLGELESCCSDHIKGRNELFFCKALIKQIQEECESDVCEVFKVLKRYYSWINFGLIESIIDGFLGDDAKVQKQWTKYQSHYKEYCSERVCEIPKPLNGTQTFSESIQQENTRVAFKIEYKWREIRFDRLDNFIASINRLLGLKPYTLCLYTVEQGCVELVFEVPQHAADVIFPPTEEQLLALQKHNITYSGELECTIIIATCVMIQLHRLCIFHYYVGLCVTVYRAIIITLYSYTLNCIIMSL